MTLTLKIDGAGRGATLKELHALAVGDLYNPLVLDFSSLGAEGAWQVDFATLSLRLMRGAAGAVVASVPMFSRVSGHWAEARAVLLLSNDQLDGWFAEAASGGDDAVRAVAWLEVSDASRTYAACDVPILLRRSSARGEGDLAGYYTASQVDALLALKQQALTFDPSPVSGSSNPVASGGIFEALAAKADLAAVNGALALKADASSVEAALASKADADAVVGALGLKADAADVAEALASKADAEAVSAALASMVTLSALDNALRGYTDTEALNRILGGYATTAALESALESVPDLSDVNAALGGKADKSYVDTALVGKADKSYVDTALSGKAGQSEVTEALAGKVGTSELETALAEKADKSEMTDALAGKADQSAVTEALALKADAGSVNAALERKADTETVNSQISSMVTREELERALSGIPGSGDVSSALALKADKADVDTALALKADASSLSSLSAAVSGKAEASETYTKTQVDSLLADLSGSGPSGGQPSIFFISDSDVIPVQSGGDTLVNVVGAVFDGPSLSRLALVGVDPRWSGAVELNADNGFESTFAGGGTASYDVDGGILTLAYGGVTITASVTIPSGGVGTPASPLADVSPTSGHADRFVSSGGVAEALGGKVSTDLHAEDLYATRLIAAQNATSAARASNAAAHNLRLILDLEARLAGVAEGKEP